MHLIIKAITKELTC